MHHYAPLDESRHEIRVLDLQPGNFDDDIKCRLRHVRLANTLEFSALSYTWGDPKVQRPIIVDGDTIQVRINLFHALQYMRDISNVRTFWIDALCINQTDVDERNKQVLRMRDIYAIATAVEVWLGLADPDDPPAMELVQNLGAVVSDPEEPLARGFYSDYEEQFLEQFENSTPQTIKAMAQLFKRPWWTRIWVVQELSLAKQTGAIVRCGQQTVPWLAFLVTAYAIESSWFILEEIISGAFPDYKLDAFNHGIRMAQCRRVNPLHPPYTLLELLNQHRDCEATDPKDKVYGLLGLSGDVDRLGIKPNYNFSVQQIFVEIFERHVEATQSLDIICGIRFPRAFDDLPSWVPDWSTDQTVPGICINDRYVGGNDFPGSPIAHFEKYAASGVSSPQVIFSGKQMLVAGIKLGTIVTCGRPDEGMAFEDVETFGRADKDGKSESESETFNEWLNMVLDSPTWDNIAERYGVDNVLESFCRTLIGDRNNRMMKPPEVTEDRMEVERYVILALLGLYEAYIFSDDAELDHDLDQSECRGNDLEDVATAEEDDVSLSSLDNILFVPHEMLSMTEAAFRSTIQVAWGKRFAILDSGHFSLVPKQAAAGDCVAIMLGCTMPIVIRPRNGSTYTVVGESYVHGAMTGELVEDSVSEILVLE
jgi:hypothetical protein